MMDGSEDSSVITLVCGRISSSWGADGGWLGLVIKLAKVCDCARYSSGDLWWGFPLDAQRSQTVVGIPLSINSIGAKEMRA